MKQDSKIPGKKQQAAAKRDDDTIKVIVRFKGNEVLERDE